MNAMTRAALKSLIKQVGIFRSLLLIVGLILDQVKGRPFHLLPKAIDHQDQESRKQIGPAILVYQRLRHRYDQNRALDITRQVVIASGRTFLSTVLQSLDIDHLINLPPEARESYLRPLLDPIPNAVYTLEFSEDHRVYFTVNSCRFAQLCTQLNVPELAPLFCEVDDYFFRYDLPQVDLERSTTIAHGGEHCPFILSLNETKETVADT